MNEQQFYTTVRSMFPDATFNEFQTEDLGESVGTILFRGSDMSIYTLYFLKDSEPGEPSMLLWAPVSARETGVSKVTKFLKTEREVFNDMKRLKMDGFYPVDAQTMIAILGVTELVDRVENAL